ncbi:MAG: TRAP transporter small permease [Rhodocyclaceae bacterium]|jgi:TRAP-type C4-dicarboxylate transport system permease small subunit|nr:TRAP transporter small permease [Rhodocyclaceae bacterium]MCL4759992.1 TRAP transporter small permease [Rhodocyclaceae bacterium]
MGEALAHEHVRPAGPLGRALDLACRGFALGGGLVLSAMALMSVASIVGRAAFGKPITGDFELVQMGCAISVTMFLPFCQMVRGHIIVDFFTARMPPRVLAILDTAASVLLAAVAFLVAWRLAIGLQELRGSGDSSMILRVPTWYAYVPMVPSFVLLGLAALYTAFVNALKVPA